MISFYYNINDSTRESNLPMTLRCKKNFNLKANVSLFANKMHEYKYNSIQSVFYDRYLIRTNDSYYSEDLYRTYAFNYY